MMASSAQTLRANGPTFKMFFRNRRAQYRRHRFACESKSERNPSRGLGPALRSVHWLRLIRRGCQSACSVPSTRTKTSFLSTLFHSVSFRVAANAQTIHVTSPNARLLPGMARRSPGAVVWCPPDAIHSEVRARPGESFAGFTVIVVGAMLHVAFSPQAP